MSILSDLRRDLVALLFPPLCPACGRPLVPGEEFVCTYCRVSAPLTEYWNRADNPVFRKFWGLVPVERAAAFLFYVRDSEWRHLIHGFKYRGAWRAARSAGSWFGRYLADSGLYATVDLVVPLPLHPLKFLRRGYNQTEYISEGIAAQLGVDLDRASVVRSRNTASQALRPHRERAANVEGAFAVRRPERLAGKHILLVDDVMTTGSTLVACIEAILGAVPDCRVSVAALAVSRYELGERE